MARIMITTESVQTIIDASAQNSDDYDVHGGEAIISCSCAVLLFQSCFQFFYFFFIFFSPPTHLRKDTRKQ